MSSSLRDQLLKAGLVTEKQVREAEKAARRTEPRKPKRAAAAPAPSAAERARAEKAERDRELNRRKAEKAEAKARAAQIRQIVEQHRVPPSDDGDPFHFQDGGRIKRIYVTDEQRRKIVDGSLAIARYGKSFALVPPAIAEKIRERDPEAVVNLATATSAASDDVDDAYKGFEVPDDLMW
ncbi:MAG TPA: DUF2058 domain-containing protein [Gammaproteobacteria bacterium]